MVVGFYDTELTPKENQLVRYLLENGYKRDRDIAKSLKVSTNTVRRHIDSIKNKKDF